MPQIIVSVTSEGHIVSVQRNDSFERADIPALFPPFMVGERAVGAALVPSVRSSPFLTEEQKTEAIQQLTLFVPGARIVGVTVPAPAVVGGSGEPVPNELLAVLRGNSGSSFVLNPGLLILVDP